MRVAVCLRNSKFIQELAKRAVSVQICNLPSQFVSTVADEHWTDQVKIFRTYQNIDRSKFVFIGELSEPEKQELEGVRVVSSISELVGEEPQREQQSPIVDDEEPMTTEEIEEAFSVIWLPKEETPDYGDLSDEELFEFADDIISAPVDIALEEDEAEAIIGNEERIEEIAVEKESQVEVIDDEPDIVVIQPQAEDDKYVLEEVGEEPVRETEEAKEEPIQRVAAEAEEVPMQMEGAEPEEEQILEKAEVIKAEVTEDEEQPEFVDEIAEESEESSQSESNIVHAELQIDEVPVDFTEDELDLDILDIKEEAQIAEDTDDYSVSQQEAAFDSSGKSLVATPSIITFDESDESLTIEDDFGDEEDLEDIVPAKRKKIPKQAKEISQVITRFKKENRSISAGDTFVPVVPSALLESRPVSVESRFVVNRTRGYSGRCYVFGSAGGRSDSYLVAYNYACECSRVGLTKVILIDLDISSATLSRRIYEEAGLSFGDSCGIENVLKISASEYIGNLPVFTNQVSSQCGDTFSFIRGNDTYPHQVKRLLMQANFNLLVDNLKHIFDVVIIDVGSLKDLQKYKIDLLRAGHSVIVTYGCGTKRSVVDGQMICERLPCNCELVLTDYRITVNPIEVSKITHRRVCGTLPSIGWNTRSVPVFSEISSNGMDREWAQVVNALNRI